MKSEIKLIFLGLTLVSYIANASVESYNTINASLSNGRGEISAIEARSGQLRISSIQDSAQRQFALSGSLLDGGTVDDFASDCRRVYSYDVRALRDLPDSLKLSGIVFPYTQEMLANLFGQVPQNKLEVVSVEAAITLGAYSMSSKAFNTKDLGAFTRAVNQKIAVDLDKVKKGQQVDFNFTGLGPLVCDLLSGQAHIKFLVRLTHEGALAKVYVPITAAQVSTLSRNLIVNNSWNRSFTENLQMGSVLVMQELQGLNVGQINLNSTEKAKESWTGHTFVSLLAELFDEQTAKPKILSEDAAREIAEKLTVTSFDKVVSVISVEPVLQGAK